MLGKIFHMYGEFHLLLTKETASKPLCCALWGQDWSAGGWQNPALPNLWGAHLRVSLLQLLLFKFSSVPLCGVLCCQATKRHFLLLRRNNLLKSIFLFCFVFLMKWMNVKHYLHNTPCHQIHQHPLCFHGSILLIKTVPPSLLLCERLKQMSETDWQTAQAVRRTRLLGAVRHTK